MEWLHNICRCGHRKVDHNIWYFPSGHGRLDACSATGADGLICGCNSYREDTPPLVELFRRSRRNSSYQRRISKKSKIGGVEKTMNRLLYNLRGGVR